MLEMLNMCMWARFSKKGILVIWPTEGIIVNLSLCDWDHIIMWIYLGYSTRGDPDEQVSRKVTTGFNTRLGVSLGVF